MQNGKKKFQGFDTVKSQPQRAISPVTPQNRAESKGHKNL